MGANRELKKAEEAYWAGRISKDELLQAAAQIRRSNWLLQKEAGIDLIPGNDFSFYDQTLDLSLCIDAVPERYNTLRDDRLELYFAMAHGYQKNGIDVTAMEMTKWFDTNYHYIVPEFVQIDEPSLCTDLTPQVMEAYRKAYAAIAKATGLKIILTTYFGGLADNAALAAELKPAVLHIDLVRAPESLDGVIDVLPAGTALSLGVVDGRNIWKNDFRKSLEIIEDAKSKLGQERIIVATSCSLLHSPFDLENEHNGKSLPVQVKRWLSFARQKVAEERSPGIGGYRENRSGCVTKRAVRKTRRLFYCVMISGSESEVDLGPELIPM